MSSTVPRSAAYLGDDRSGTEFWLSGPHVFSVPADATRPRIVCSLARFNRRGRSRGRCFGLTRERPPVRRSDT